MTNKNSPNFKITTKALKRIIEVQSKENNIGKHLRISVHGGGCSGFQYKFELDKEISKDDLQITEDKKLIAVIDEVSMNFLQGCELDYNESLGGSFFKINNPNASSTCGCGSSFSV